MELCKFSKIFEYNFSLFMAPFHKSCRVIQCFLRGQQIHCLVISPHFCEGGNKREELEEADCLSRPQSQSFILVSMLMWDTSPETAALHTPTTFLREGGWLSLCSGSFFSLQILKYFLIICKEKYALFISHSLPGPVQIPGPESTSIIKFLLFNATKFGVV